MKGEVEVTGDEKLIDGSWVWLRGSVGDKVTSSSPNYQVYSWEVGRPYQSSTFNLKANTDYVAYVGSFLTDTKKDQFVAKHEASFTSFDLKLVEGATALAASGVLAVLAALSF